MAEELNGNLLVPGPEENLIAVEESRGRGPNEVFYKKLFHGALNDLIIYPTQHKLHRRAYSWFFEERGEIDWCSFNSLCNYLGKDRAKLRFLVNHYYDQRSGRVRTQVLPVECDKVLEMAGR